MSEEKKYTVISEGQHWYDYEGTPMPDTVPKADGKGRRTFTLKDARKYGAFPSVSAMCYYGESTVGIDNWDRNLLIDAMKAEDDIDKALAAYRKTRDQASSTGTDIHSAIQRVLTGKAQFGEWPQYKTHAENVANWLLEQDLEHVFCERAFCNTEYGVGGTLDYMGMDGDGKMLLADWKSVKHASFKSFKPKPAHVRQIAAYAILNDVYPCQLWVVGIDQESGDIKPCEVDNDMAEWGWSSFRANLAAFKWDRRYFPDTIPPEDRWTSAQVEAGTRDEASK